MDQNVNLDPPVVNTDVARSKTRAFLARHKTKFTTAGILTGSAVVFLAGRKSKDRIESVDVVVTPADEAAQD